jgi:hypothetical protein
MSEKFELPTQTGWAISGTDHGGTWPVTLTLEQDGLWHETAGYQWTPEEVLENFEGLHVVWPLGEGNGVDAS